MKNACIVLRQNSNSVLGEDFLTLDNLFSANGYAFEEVRILSLSQSVSLTTALAQRKNDCENVVILCEQTAMPLVNSIVKETLSVDANQNGQVGFKVYVSGNKTWLILAIDSAVSIRQQANACISLLNHKYSLRMDKYVVRAVGAREEYIHKLLSQARNCSGERIAYRHSRKFGEDCIEIYYNETTPKMLVDDVIRIFAEGLAECIYALGEDVTLEEQLVRLLKLRGCKVSVAESFTGGGVGRRIVSVSGASEVYFEGLNTYDSLSKIKRLGVSEYTLKTLGAVSDQTAYEMATGLLKTRDCNISIATTGFAGPKTDGALLRVGLCYIAIGTREKVYVYRYIFEGERKNVIETGINYALFHAYKQLKNI